MEASVSAVKRPWWVVRVCLHGGYACLQRGQGSPRMAVDVGSVVWDGRSWKGQVRVIGMRWLQLCQKMEMWHILLGRDPLGRW